MINHSEGTADYPGFRPHPRGYVALRTSVPPSLDGKLTGPWEAAPWSDPFLDIEGPDKPTPRHATCMKMLWDDHALYIAAWMEEPHPWASLTLHDAVIFKDNDFEVFIDPDGDNHAYYEFEVPAAVSPSLHMPLPRTHACQVNALGTWWDLFLIKPYRDGGPPLMSFESIAPSEPTIKDGPTGWEPVRRAVWVDGALNDPSVRSRGWGVEMEFPWSLLRQAANRDCPPKACDQWRINFSRVQWRIRWDDSTHQYVKDPPDQAEDNWVWSPQWAIAMHQPEYWGYVQFDQRTITPDHLEAIQVTASGGGKGSQAPAVQQQPCGSGQGTPAAVEQSPDQSEGQAPGSVALDKVEGMVPQTYPVILASSVDGFKPDPTWPLRCFLMEVYRRQRARPEESGFVSSLKELDLPEPGPDVAQHAKVQATEGSFLAAGQLPVGPEGKPIRLAVNEEGRIRSIRPVVESKENKQN